MKYLHCLLQISVALMLVVVTGVILGSVNRLPKSAATRNIQSASATAMVLAVIMTGYALLTCGNTYRGVYIVTRPPHVYIHVVIGLILFITGIIIHSSADKLPDSVEKDNIHNSSVPMLMFGFLLAGEPILNSYTNYRTIVVEKL